MKKVNLLHITAFALPPVGVVVYLHMQGHILKAGQNPKGIRLCVNPAMCATQTVTPLLNQIAKAERLVILREKELIKEAKGEENGY